MKKCSKCGETKPETEFSVTRASADGRYGYCKPCAAKVRRDAREMVRLGQKTCGRCGLTKPLDEFYGYKRGAERRQAWCKVCQKEAIIGGYREDPAKHAAYNREWGRQNPDKKADIALKTRLGLPHGTYERMLKACAGRCEICGTDKPRAARLTRFCVDHDAITGQVRGLLCGSCNQAIGLFLHSVPSLLAAIQYLLKYNQLSESARVRP